ncbi:hypothetical protein [Clostridium taeniosporum]|uniref:DNA and RNA helicase n=1 Tax=Clostridium taeniosporum TaxID=394958 RepID=A0A1D7XJG1_9CLOT|nr:hypothetical protein [Clostridium taeniosporum]AOR23477.1 hypothetical protein BGI42_06875 [Clostridium taeniosporum]
MFENRYPLFESGRLLKIDMLNELRDYPRIFIDIMLKEYCDGIISGCSIDVENDFLIVKKGIIKYNEVIYILKEDTKIKYECNNKFTIVKVKFLREAIDKDFIKNCTEFYLDDELELNENEMELCRFQLREGAHLRINYTGFEDLSTEYDTVNIINTPYSTKSTIGLSPIILKMFGRELIKCNINEAWDITFATMCIQNKDAIEKDIIISYLSYKLNIQEKDYSNEELYLYLLEVLKKQREDSGTNNNHKRGRFKKILID